MLTPMGDFAMHRGSSVDVHRRPPAEVLMECAEYSLPVRNSVQTAILAQDWDRNISAQRVLTNTRQPSRHLYRLHEVQWVSAALLLLRASDRMYTEGTCI